MEDVVFIALFFIATLLVLFLIFKPVSKDRKARNNVTNFDLLTQHYCFILTNDQSNAINQLATRNINDILEYVFDADCKTIVFKRFGASVECKLSFYIVENKTYLKVSRVKLLHATGNIPLMINRFFIEKIGAIPVDYTHFRTIVCTQ